MMDNMDALWVRACKSKDPHVRLVSVYRRFYMGYGNKFDDIVVKHALAVLLGDVVYKHQNPDIRDMASYLNPNSPLNQCVQEHEPYDYLSCLVDFYCGQLRFAGKDDLPEFPIPRRFRKD